MVSNGGEKLLFLFSHDRENKVILFINYEYGSGHFIAK